MKLYMAVDAQPDDEFAHMVSTKPYWVAHGEGPMRGIVVEGNNRAEARKSWMQEFARQYEEMERQCHYARQQRRGV